MVNFSGTLLFSCHFKTVTKIFFYNSNKTIDTTTLILCSYYTLMTRLLCIILEYNSSRVNTLCNFQATVFTFTMFTIQITFGVLLDELFDFCKNKILFSIWSNENAFLCHFYSISILSLGFIRYYVTG